MKLQNRKLHVGTKKGETIGYPSRDKKRDKTLKNNFVKTEEHCKV